MNAFKSETVQLEAFRSLLQCTRIGSAPPSSAGIQTPSSQVKESAPKKKPGKGGKRPFDSVQIVKDLNLRPKGKKAFAEFCTEKKPRGFFEFYVVAIYYLKHELELEKVNPNHVFTCMRAIGLRAPKNLWSNMRTCSSRHGYIDTKDSEDLKVTTHGENLVLHDLPEKASEKGASQGGNE